MEQKANNMATASLVMGILSIVLSCCCCMCSVFGGLAVLFACLSKTDGPFDGKALAGLITGIIGILLGFVGFIGWLVFVAYQESVGTDWLGIYGALSDIRPMATGGLL